MKYDRDRKIVRGILKTADIANTLNGGMSQPVVTFDKKENHYKVTVKTPGVAVESLNVEIVNNLVIVSHSLSFNFGKENLDIPHVVATVPITLDVDYKNITAMQENGKLEVIMPFNELAGDYRKRVDVSRS